VVSCHILRDTTRSIKFVQATLTSGGTAEIVQPSYDLEHGRESGFSESKTQALMGSEPEVSVCVHVTVKSDLLGLLENNGVPARRYL